MEQHLLELGQVINTHELDGCMGRWCAIHRPMPGPWSTWPRYWREDLGIMERLCPCPVGHPVAEMYEYTVAQGRMKKLAHICCGIHPCTPIDGAYE
jgi:hypothetical protein